jgi:uncharacterized membrane protein (Fun14 family)
VKYLVLLALLIFSQFSFAQISTEGLTPEQVKALNEQVSKLKAQPENISATVRQEAEAWGELGANMGRAMVSAAREVGVAANEFSQTTLGKITVAIIVYKIVGQDILQIMSGITLLMICLTLAAVAWRAKIGATNIEYEHIPYLKGMWVRRRVVRVTYSDEARVVKTIFSIAMILIGLVFGFNLII